MASALSNNRGVHIVFYNHSTKIGEWEDYSGPIPDVGDKVCVTSFGFTGRVVERTFYEYTLFMNLEK